MDDRLPTYSIHLKNYISFFLIFTETSMQINPHKPGASCLKSTMSLVNDSSKFQMAILHVQIHRYFFVDVRINAKDLRCKGFSHFFFNKNNSVFAFEVDIYM